MARSLDSGISPNVHTCCVSESETLKLKNPQPGNQHFGKESTWCIWGFIMVTLVGQSLNSNGGTKCQVYHTILCCVTLWEGVMSQADLLCMSLLQYCIGSLAQAGTLSCPLAGSPCIAPHVPLYPQSKMTNESAASNPFVPERNKDTL